MTTEDSHKVGDILRQGRLRQRLSIAECAKRTHIAVRFIEALEDERWSDLPSESHRLGFLKLYARFLGVSADDAITQYQKNAVSGNPHPNPAPANEHANPLHMQPQAPGWSPSSIPQLIGFAILLLLSAWLIYHAVSPLVSEQNPMPWTHRRPTQQARLVVTKTSITSQKVKIKADANTWLRVTSRNQLLFEGILPGGAFKEWSGAGPFQLKIGNVRTISVFWNDNPLDIVTGAHGPINQVRIPPQ